MRSPRRARRPLVALVALVVALIVGYAVRGGTSSDDPAGPSGSASGSSSVSSSGSASASADGAVALSSLPAQAATTVALIRAGGPFPYPRNDGVVFHNNERRLPREADGWYHEYTVPTPGSPTRGARRIITARDGTYFWTGDHYETFRRVDLTR